MFPPKVVSNLLLLTDSTTRSCLQDIYESEEWGFSTIEVTEDGEELTLFFWGDAPEDAEPPLRFNKTLYRKYPRTAAPQVAP